MDVTLISYLFYAAVAILVNFAVATYLFSHWRTETPASRLFMTFVALNFVSDGSSKAWFAIWRLSGKPSWMVDHVFVDTITFSAAVSACVALWFWTRTRIGNVWPIALCVVVFFLSTLISLDLR